MLQKLYKRSIEASTSPKASWWMAGLSFTESSFFLIPPDIMLVPMCLARRDRALFYGALCTVASVLGGVLGYYLGLALFESLGQRLVELYGAEEAFDHFRHNAHELGFWVLALKGLTPIPYKIVAIAAGAVAYSLPMFILASAIGRGARFMLIAWLCRKYGASVQGIMDRYGGAMMAGLLVAVLGGVFVLKYV